MSRKSGAGTRNILVLGTSATSMSVARSLTRHLALGYRIVGFLGNPSPALPERPGAAG